MGEHTTPKKTRRNMRLAVSIVGLLFLLLCAAWLHNLTTAPTGAILNQAIDKASVHPGVTAALGSPIAQGPSVPGNRGVIRYEGLAIGYVGIPSPIKTSATIDIPVVGPKGAGTIQGRAFKSDGKWYFANLNVHVTTGAGPFRVVEAPSVIDAES